MNKSSVILPMSLNQPNQEMEMLKRWSTIYVEWLLRACPN